jgi:hypothetical protein
MDQTPSRRRFLTSSLLGLGALGALSKVTAATLPKPGFLTEAERDIPLSADADIIVCGAGPAGVTAAIAAARAGAKVRLFEAHGSLGGVWTSSLLGYLLDFDKPGFNQELVRRLRDRHAVVGEGVNGISYHPEDMKLVLEELCLAAGVTVHFHTRVVAVHKVGRRVNAIVTESKSGREAWQAGTFIDATGDGDVGALAGCEFEIGMADACPCQPVSMDALLVVKDATKLTRFIHGSGSAVSKQSMNDSKKNLLAEIKRGGFDPSYQGPTIFPIRDNLLLAMMNHEYGIDATDAAAVTKATLNARAELHRIVKALRALGGDWEGLQIVATPEQIGIRDGRRIKGRYKVVKGDLVAGARHEDSVVRATFSVDVHALTRKDPAYSNQGVKVKPYDIPLRALIAKDVDGLMMAGRCISGDFIAHASYRVTGNAVAMGEAAGVTSALAASSKRAPHEVSWPEASALLPKVRQG